MTIFTILILSNIKSLWRGWAPPKAHYTLQPTLKAYPFSFLAKEAERPIHKVFPIFKTHSSNKTREEYGVKGDLLLIN
jgi:hypothetical protein